LRNPTLDRYSLTPPCRPSTPRAWYRERVCLVHSTSISLTLVSLISSQVVRPHLIATPALGQRPPSIQNFLASLVSSYGYLRRIGSERGPELSLLNQEFSCHHYPTTTISSSGTIKPQGSTHNIVTELHCPASRLHSQ